jgi:acetyl esterase
MAIRPDTALFLASAEGVASFPAEASHDVDAAARYLRQLRASRATDEPEPVAHSSEHDLGGGLRVRAYVPRGDDRHSLVIYFHGGGWVSGDLEMHDGVCRRLANRAQCVVVNVDYRLAPEHPFPAAIDDAFRAVVWSYEHAADLLVTGRGLAVVGSSSGGNLAAAVALRARDEGRPPITLQVLLYPALDASMSSPSFRELHRGYLLEADQMAWFWRQYLGDGPTPPHEWASPLQASSLIGLPRAVIVTAELDPLRDEGESYAERLRESGVEVSLERYEGQIHGFIGFHRAITDGEAALDAIAAQIREHVDAPS